MSTGIEVRLRSIATLLLFAAALRVQAAAEPSKAEVEEWLKEATAVQVSYIGDTSENGPLTKAIHFRCDFSRKMAWIAGYSFFENFRWSKRALSPVDRDKVLKTLGTLDFESGQKEAGDGLFQVVINTPKGNHHLKWKDSYYYSGKGVGPTERVVSFLNAMIEDDRNATMHFSPFDGDVSLALYCNSLTPEGRIRIVAVNRGNAPARLRPVFETHEDGTKGTRIVAYWGYPPLAKGDATASIELLPDQQASMAWDLDLTAELSPAQGLNAELSFVAEGLIDAGLPQEIAPLFITIGRCSLPDSLASTMRSRSGRPPSPIVETWALADERQLASLYGVWSSHSEEAGASPEFHLVVSRPVHKGGQPEVLFIGTADFGEHGTACYSTKPSIVEFNSAEGKLRFHVGMVEYYHNLSPKRPVPRPDEPPTGGGWVNLDLEGKQSGDSLVVQGLSGDSTATFLRTSR